MNQYRHTFAAWIRRFALLAALLAGPLFLTVHPTFAQTPTGEIIDLVEALDPGEVVRVEEGELRQVAFSPDEGLLAVATSAGLWLYAPTETANGEILSEAPAQGLWWSPDSSLLAVTLDDGSLALWQIEERELLGDIDGTADAIVSVAWLADGSQIATGTEAGVIEIWSVTEGVVLETLEGHTGAIRSLYWLTDGSQIVSAAADGSVRVWGVEVAVAVQPTATPTPAPTPAIATVQVNRLNVRSGPGVDFPRIATGLLGEALTVLDQAEDCAWVQVRIPDGTEGWVAGGAQFVTLDTPCDEIIPVERIAEPAPTPTVASLLPLPTPTPNLGAAPTPASSPTPTPTPQPVTEAPAEEAPVDPFPADQGCYLFQNQLPVALTLFMARNGELSGQPIDLAPGQESPACFEPGSYTYTIRYQLSSTSEPTDISGDIEVTAGARLMFPIRAQ